MEKTQHKQREPRAPWLTFHEKLIGFFGEYCLLCTAGRGTLDAEDVEDVEDVADVEDVKDVEDRTWRT